MNNIPKKRGLFGENSNVPLVSSTEQVVHFNGTMGTTLDEVINDIDTSKVGEVYMSDGGTLTPMTTTDEDGKKITILPKDQFEKIADVKLNGASILNSENVANINISASVSNTTGTPAVTPVINGGNVALNFSGIKGEQGDSAIWDENEPHEKLTDIANSLGDSTVKPISQKGVTQELASVFDMEIDWAEHTTIPKTLISYSATPPCWKVQSSNSNNCKVIPIQEGWKAIHIEPYINDGEEVAYYVDFITTTEPGANNEAVSFAGTIRGEKTHENDEYVIPIPQGAAAIYVMSTNGSNRCLPQSIKVSRGLQGLKESLEAAIENSGDEIRDEITESAEAVINTFIEGREPNYYKDKYFKFVLSNPTGVPEDKAGCGVFKENIPITNGYAITWRFGTQNIGALVIYDSNGDAIANFGASEIDGDRNIGISSIPANAAYLNCSFDLSKVTIPLTIDGVDYSCIEPIPSLRDMVDYGEVKERVEALEDIVSPTDTEHGFIGINYPEQVKEINNHLGTSLGDRNSTYFKRLQFLHVSDNHGIADAMGYASQFLGYCPAKFLVNTGDLVVDKYTDSHRTVDTYAVAAAKPVYLVLGNHDYYKCPSHQDQYDTWYGDAETEGTLNYHNAQLNGAVAEHTYYSVDDSTANVKCIILDMNDGWPDEGLGTRELDDFSVGKMSQTQIEWFISELQAARTNNYHVCIFIHILPEEMDGERLVVPFTDRPKKKSNDAAGDLSFLHDLVDGFINGGVIEFTYDNIDYNATFSEGGHLVSWFCGHTHWDSVGWLKNYPDQFAVIITRPNASQMYYGGVGAGKDGETTKFNFVTIDTKQNSLSVYRIGQQKTIWGVDRKSFRIFYK